MERGDGLSFDAGEADPCRGARSPVRGHVPLRNVETGVSGPPGETGPGKGYFRSRDGVSDSFKNSSSPCFLSPLL